MYIAGSVKDIKSVLMAAKDLKARAIHFIAPNTIFILSHNQEDYLYLKTTITIGNSVMVPKTTYNNMYVYLRNAGKLSGLNDSKAITSVVFEDEKILFNHSNELALDVPIIAFPLQMKVDDRIEESIATSYDVSSPYLRISYESMKKLHRELYRHKKRFKVALSSSDNQLRVEDDQLVLYYRHDHQVARIETGITEFARNLDHEVSFRFSDRAFYLMKWLIRSTPIEELVFLPRKDYCVLEGYMSNMVVKVRTMVKNDIELGKPL